LIGVGARLRVKPEKIKLFVIILFFRLFVHGRSLAPLTVLFEFYFTLHLFAVFATPVVNPLALPAGELDEVIL